MEIIWLTLFSIIIIIIIIIVVVIVTPNRRTSAASQFYSLHRQLQQPSDSNSPYLTLIGKFTASNSGARDRLGIYNAVAISNNRIVTGAWGNNRHRGAAYLLGDPKNPESGTEYSQLAILTASDAQEKDNFGDSVAMDKDIIVLGATEFDSGGPGAAYVFRILTQNNTDTTTSTTMISQVTKLTASDGMAKDTFGGAVAIHGKYILVGSRWDERNNEISFSNVGSAYLFGNTSMDPNNPAWTQLQKLQPPDLSDLDAFGWSMAMDENIAVIGTNGSDAHAAYVFAPTIQDGNETGSSSFPSWTQTAKLTGSFGSYFGFSVAVTGNWIVVGAYGDADVGAVLVFTNTSTGSFSSWTQVTRLVAADGSAGDEFGRSVAISKDASTIVVGASGADYNTSITNSGAAYLFGITNSTTATTTLMAAAEWTQIGKFVADDRAANDTLGASIAIENSIVVVGAPYDDDFTYGLSDSGSVYILDTGFSAPTTAPMANPVTIATPIPARSPSTTVPVPPDDTFSTGEMVGVSAIVVVGFFLIVYGISVLNYRIKLRRQTSEHQQAPTLMADLVEEPPPEPPVQDRTLAVHAFLDPASAAAALTVVPTMANPAIQKLSMYNDPIRNIDPTGDSTNMPSVPGTEKTIPQHDSQNQRQQQQQDQTITTS
jgi:hypothetical protein